MDLVSYTVQVYNFIYKIHLFIYILNEDRETKIDLNFISFKRMNLNSKYLDRTNGYLSVGLYEKIFPECIVSNIKHDNGSPMVPGCFSMIEVQDLICWTYN